ncbi:histidine phosphatase family protein [Hyphococcus sp.]|uniref:histidine phosphatase family protein n=1 Tax=Hyphococcus sp. TaxID=2038636 RepID=UPI0035C6D1E5
MTRTVYFIRHGQTEWNAERRMQGQWESDLTELGRAQAKQTAAAVAALGVEAIYASPLRRASESAQALCKTSGLPATYDDRLKEWSAGDWSGCLYADIVTRWPDEWAAWRKDMWGYRPPNAENFADLKERGAAFLEDLSKTQADRIAIVSHGFITRAMIAHLLDLSPDDALHLETPNDAFFRLRTEPAGWRAERYEAGSRPVSLFNGVTPPDLA